MAKEEFYQQQYQQLLQSLKGTVEGLLISQVSNVWNIYGGLNRLHSSMEKIFKHGCRVFNPDGDPDCWIFIQGLSWLQPSSAASPSFLCDADENFAHLPPDMTDKALIWLYRSLEGHTLSQKLSWLLSDREHLESCFEKCAFLCQEKYGEAALICLRAVEQNQPTLLTEINPCLYLSTWNYKAFQRSHRRCSSFPEAQYKTWQDGKVKSLKVVKQSSEGAQPSELDDSFTDLLPLPKSDPLAEHTLNVEMETSQSECEEALQIKVETDIVSEKTDLAYLTSIGAKIRPWTSLPSLVNDEVTGKEHNSTREVDLASKSAPVHSRLKQLSNGSQTLPSSPIKLSKCHTDILHYHGALFKSSTILSKASIANCDLPISLRLSPSVLEVDYSSELQSEASSSTPNQKANRNWKPIHMKNVPKDAINKKTVRSHSDAGTTYTSQIKSKLTSEMGADVSSGSTETLHPDMNKSSDESLSKTNLLSNTDTSGPCIRPSELKLLTGTWEGGDGGKRDKQKRRKPVIVGSAPESAGDWLASEAILDTKVKVVKKSFIEDGGSSVLPMATGFFPQPVEGQSLTSFLSSGHFSRPSAELDRENAHFSISEAMIAAIEQVKCNRQLRLAEEVAEESDEEINHLKQRIRIRRRQCQEAKHPHLWGGVSLLSDGKTDTTTTDQSVSPISSSPGTPSESISTDDVDDLEVDEVGNLAQLKHAGLSVSMASLYSEADLSKQLPVRTSVDVAMTESVVSAEGVALSLLRQFSEKQLPRASDLQWLVSEQDAPQQLLPLPTSWPISPDEAEDADMRQATPLRGTMEWAPPRPQVIFTPHVAPVHRVVMARQGYRCAGCGMKVAPEYAHRFRYCEYLGRYFCTGCHSNQRAFIPGKILTKWDFTRCPVSSFSYQLLDQMLGDPLFRIGDLNPMLYRKAKQLERTRQLRLQLYYLKDFILTCRFAEQLQEALQREPVYLLTEMDVYSMQDLVQTKSGELASRLRALVSCSSQHVSECQLCQARGFVCELCSSKEVIYPWHLGKVTQCNICGACFHTGCWTPSPCPRCTRLVARRVGKENTGWTCDDVPYVSRIPLQPLSLPHDEKRF